MVAAVLGAVLGLHGIGMHFDPSVRLDTTRVVMSHQCSTDCGIDD